MNANLAADVLLVALAREQALTAQLQAALAERDAKIATLEAKPARKPRA